MVAIRQPKPDEESAVAPLIVLTLEESRRHFDELARELVGMSGEDFIRKLKAGEFLDIPDDEEHRAYVELSVMAGVER